MIVRQGRFTSAARDVVQGLELTPIWWQVGLNQLVGRYRRTILGPFWIAGSLLATALALWFVFGALLGGDYHKTFPHIVAGILVWSLVGGSAVEATSIFVASAGVMQMHRFPLTYHVLLQTDRVMINFAHQLVAFWLVILVLRHSFDLHWSFIPALALVTVAVVAMSLVIGMISARYKDVAYFVGIAMQVMFFLTPVFWSGDNLPPNRRFIVDLNPFAQMLNILRRPLLGEPPTLYNWMFVGLFTLATCAVAYLSLVLFRKRVVFWV